jgi:3',5'-cyclic AMP phosphodiesterase CpdA
MFRLAHLSDPHLGPLPEPKVRELMSKRVLGYLNWRLHRGGAMRPAVLDDLVADVRAQAPDHIAVTGDIVNIALDAELEPARQWLGSLGPGTDVSLVPGNHDAYVPGALKRASGVWAPFMVGDGFDHVRFPYVRHRGKAAIIGVSSARASGPFMATGHMDASQALLLSEALTHAGHEGRIRVVLIHHPPIDGATVWAGRLIGAHRFREAIRTAGADLVLHGHTHTSSLNWIEGRDGPVPVVGVPSASAKPNGSKRGAGWNLFEITGRPGRWQIDQIERGFEKAGSGMVELRRQTLLPTA